MATSQDRQHYALQTIFSFFLGLMVLAFIGVGVNTFLPSPAEQHQEEQRAIQRKMEAINIKMSPTKSLDATQQAEMEKLQKQQNVLQDKIDAEMKAWARTTSIILVIFATLILVVSLALNEKLRVISNGLLLGGLFTMVYGVGWVIFSGNSVARFVVIAFALAVTIGLGYVKFVRQRKGRLAAAPGTAEAAGTVAGAELAGLSERVSVLEARAAAAAAALQGDREARD